MCVYISKNQKWAYQYGRHLTGSHGVNAGLLFGGEGGGALQIQISVGIPTVLSKGLRGSSTSLHGRSCIVPGKAMTVSFQIPSTSPFIYHSTLYTVFTYIENIGKSSRNKCDNVCISDTRFFTLTEPVLGSF